MKNKPYPFYEPPIMNDLKHLLNRQAAEHPDETAFVYPCETGEMKKSYLDFQEDVNALGAWMYHKKIKDKHVAIIGENSYEWLVAYFATVLGGNVAVAIDKNLPEEEVVDLAKMGDVEVAFATNTYFEKINKKAAKKCYNLKCARDMYRRKKLKLY